MEDSSKILINFNEFQKILANVDSILIFDATYYLPNTGLVAKDEYEKEHIVNSLFFDIDKISDPNEKILPHMFPSKETFTYHMQKFGLNDNDTIVIYDNSPLFSSARCWFLLRYFGKKKVYIFQGGIQEWKKNGGKTKSFKDNNKFQKGNFIAQEKNTELLIKIDEIKKTSISKSKKILDARSFERFSGKGKEPRSGLQSGHIPNSLNLPATNLISSKGFLIEENHFASILKKMNIYKNEGLIATCGSGVSACVIALVFYCSGNQNISIYDGSWTEWASKGNPINKI